MTTHKQRHALSLRGGGCGGSKPVEHAGIALLAALDDKMCEALDSGAIALINADFLRSNDVGERIERRQALKKREDETTGLTIFVPPAEAVAMVRAKTREVGVLTYGWATRDHPDPSGAYLQAVRRFLRSELGAHVRAVFWVRVYARLSRTVRRALLCVGVCGCLALSRPHC